MSHESTKSEMPSEPPVRCIELVSQQRLEALVEAERVLDIMHTQYRHGGHWESVHGSFVLLKVRRAIAAG